MKKTNKLGNNVWLPRNYEKSNEYAKIIGYSIKYERRRWEEPGRSGSTSTVSSSPFLFYGGEDLAWVGPRVLSRAKTAKKVIPILFVRFGMFKKRIVLFLAFIKNIIK